MPAEKLATQKAQGGASVLVVLCVSKFGRTRPHSVDKGLEIDSSYYMRNMLELAYLPELEDLADDEKWWFIQDGAPAHTAKATVAFLQEHVAGWIPDWPANSPVENLLSKNAKYFAILHTVRRFWLDRYRAPRGNYRIFGLARFRPRGIWLKISRGLRNSAGLEPLVVFARRPGCVVFPRVALG